MARNALIQHRGDTAANWTSVNPVLAAREIGLETDTKKIKFGDGTTAWTSLGYMSAVATSTWGGITGTLSSQTDLNTALSNKQPLATVLTNTTAAFTTAQETKLAGIATGATANVGTVTSVGGTGTVSGLTLSGTVTSSGNLTLGGTLSVAASNFASQTANLFLAAPNGVAGVPTFRAVLAADIPTLNQSTTGSAATLTTGRTLGITGDLVWTSPSFNGSGNVTATGTIQAGVVSNSKLADVATATFKGRVTAGTGSPEDLTGTQATTLLDTVTSTLKGLAPASGGGTTNFLRADGTWAAPPGSGGGSGTVTDVSVVTANGVSGSVATSTTTPAITLSLGAITPSSVASVGAVSGSNLSGTNTGDQTITLTGDVTGTGTGSFAATVANDSVTNAKLANVATATIKGRVTAATGDPEDLTGTQATTLLDVVTSSLKGLAPASGGGTMNYLRADGTWTAPGTRVNAQTTTTSPWAWNSDSYDQQSFTALANALTINADAGTPVDGKKITFRIKDNGTARVLTWTTGTSKSFRAIGVTLPTTTVISKTLYIGCIYNGADSRWDVVAVAQEA